MSNAKPFTKEERAEEIALAIAAEGVSPMSREGERRSRILDYEATLRAVEAERDEARCAVDAILDKIKFLEEELSGEVPWRMP